MSNKSLRSVLDVQHGGSHYKMWNLQPVEIYAIHQLHAFSANALKYGSRFLTKNGAEDLDKLVHYLELFRGFVANGLTFTHGSTEAYREFIEANDLDNMSPATANLLRYVACVLDNPQDGELFDTLLTRVAEIKATFYGSTNTSS